MKIHPNTQTTSSGYSPFSPSQTAAVKAFIYRLQLFLVSSAAVYLLLTWPIQVSLGLRCLHLLIYLSPSLTFSLLPVFTTSDPSRCLLCTLTTFWSGGSLEWFYVSLSLTLVSVQNSSRDGRSDFIIRFFSLSLFCTFYLANREMRIFKYLVLCILCVFS